ncbi:MAG: 5'/3'-nucleotidase SurE [Ruminococcaceae bacterium]|nr:5'/3'-nucleotidase SurE [Oscillospiraceae bacterium]
MRILITNDDGIFAPGIKLLAEWARNKGEVTVVAPKREQSGMSHAINFTEPIEIKKVELMDGVEAYSCDSTPADCVRYGIMGLGREYDLVLSGINKGVNLGVDVIYSGTVAAIFEAAYWQHNALAISTYPDSQPEAAKALDLIYNYIKEKNLFAHNLIYNVNIPKENVGIKITAQGSPYFNDGFKPLGNDMYLQTGERIPDEYPLDLTRDTVAIENGYITLTPLTLNRTNFKAFEELKNS